MKNINFKIYSLDKEQFDNFFEMGENDLNKLNIKKIIVDENPGYPCRVSLEDAEIGEEVMLINYEHIKKNSPYDSKGPIFVRKNAKNKDFGVNEIPSMFIHRTLSIRGYDSNYYMIYANTIKGETLKEILITAFENEKIDFIHIHNSSPGCYNCLVKRF